MASPGPGSSSAPESLPRENLIDTAVRFLNNPNVTERPFQQKQSFLKSKGLTDEEIRISCDRANVHTSAVPRQQDTVIPMYGLHQQIVAPQPSSTWMRMRDILHTMALLGGLGYAIYWVYKSYIEPFLFGRPKPKKSTEETLSSIEEAVSKVSLSTNELRAEIKAELSRLTQEKESGGVRNLAESKVRTLAEIKSDIATVKGLLLSRQQFPGAPGSYSLRSGQASKPSIPAWQMSTEQKNSCKDEEGQSNDKDLLSQTQFEKIQDVSALDPPNAGGCNPENATDEETSNSNIDYTSRLNHETIRIVSESLVDSSIPNGNDCGVEIVSK